MAPKVWPSGPPPSSEKCRKKSSQNCLRMYPELLPHQLRPISTYPNPPISHIGKNRKLYMAVGCLMIGFTGTGGHQFKNYPISTGSSRSWHQPSQTLHTQWSNHTKMRPEPAQNLDDFVHGVRTLDYRTEGTSNAFSDILCGCWTCFHCHTLPKLCADANPLPIEQKWNWCPYRNNRPVYEKTCAPLNGPKPYNAGSSS